MRVTKLFIFLLLICLQPVMACWTEHNLIGMVHDAKRLAPENLQWILDKYEENFAKGLESQPSAVIDRDKLVQIIVADSDQAVTLFTKEMAYSRGATMLGRIAKSVSDLHTILTERDSLLKPHWRTDYAIFLQKKRSFFRIRWAGPEKRPHSHEELEKMLVSSTQRMDRVSEILVTTLNKENRAISTYDERSAPFGVGSIAYSSAVSTLAMTWLYVWDKVGGIQ